MKYILICLLAILSFLNDHAQQAVTESYKCLPCGQSCDQDSYTAPGKCTHCGMQLVKASTIHFDAVEPEKICAYLTAHPQVLLLDVRTKEEYEGKADPDFGTLKNAINIPIQELSNRLNELAGYKNKEILVYCSHSHRSPQAAYLLTQNGFAQITNMAGGMSVVTDKQCKK